VVSGWLQPVVLIPAAVLTGLTPAQLEAILVHELAHIRRQDYLINAMQTLAETLLFYHPLRQVQAQHKVGVALTSDVYEATRDAAEARAELAEAKGDKPLEAKELNAAVDAARKLVDIQRKRFEAGQLTGVDVLRSQRELTDLQVRLARLSPEAGEP